MRRTAPSSLLKAIDANDYWGITQGLQTLPLCYRSSDTNLVDEAGHSVLLRAIFGSGWPAPTGVAMSFAGPALIQSPAFNRPANIVALRALLDGGLNPALMVDDFQKRTLFHATIVMNRPDEALLLMSYLNPIVIAAADASGSTALHLAAERGMLRVVSALVGLTDIPAPSALAPAMPFVDLNTTDDCPARLAAPTVTSRACQCYIHPNVTTKTGGTALSAAIRHGSLPSIDALLAAGADPNQKFFCGDNAFMEGYTEGRHCLHMAIMARNVEAVRSLLAAGATANARTSTGYGALNFAIDVRQVTIVKELLSFGADPNAAGISGHTPLYCAADRGLLEAVHLLLDCGAITSNPYVTEMCPVDIACFRGHVPCFFEALAPNVVNAASRIPSLAVRACQGGQAGLLEAMLQRGLPITATLLREACMRRVDMLRLLIDYGGDVSDCSSFITLSCQGVAEELARQGAL